ncbi:MAG TPA: glycosyltransferase [Conexibacter sp.]|nr:glycosyltransferase [Conexibacter sp.]
MSPLPSPPVPADARALIDDLRARFPRVAVVHDWLTIPGGSEDVVLELLELFPHAELFTSVYDPRPWPPQITERPVHASFLNRVPGAVSNYPKLLPLMNRAFESFDLSGFDLVLSSSHANAKNVHTPPSTLHVCYCHTPMRYAWEPEFLAGEEIGRATRLMLPPLLGYLRRKDLAGASRPDVFVANSAYVAARIRRFYGREAHVVHAPVDVDHYLQIERRAGGAGDDDGFYLVFGRVVPYKRVDLAIAGGALAGRAVKVAGGGRGLEAVRAQAGPNAELLGRVSDDERDALLGSARALLFPGEEDFGIVPVEAQAAGLPVIAYGVGGARETVRDGVTGVLFDAQTPEAVAAAIARFEALSLDPTAPRENARGFGRGRFRAEMAAVIAQAGGVPAS